jgi:hypothetical protein
MPDVQFRVLVDTSDLERAQAAAKRIQRELQRANDPGSNEFTRQRFTSTKEVEKLQASLKLLEDTFNRVRDAREKALAAGTGVRLKGLGVTPENLEKAGLPLKPRGGQLGLEDSKALLESIQGQADGVSTSINTWTTNLETVNQRFAESLIKAGSLSSRVQEIAAGSSRQIAERAASGSDLELAVNERINSLEEKRNALIERRAFLEEGILNSVGGKVALNLQKELLSLRDAEGAALRKINSVLAARVQIEERLRASGAARVQQFIQQGREAIKGDKPLKITPPTGIDKETRGDLEAFVRLTNEYTAARSKLANVQRALIKPEGRFRELAQASGELQNFQQVNRELVALDNTIAKLVGPGRKEQLDLIAPGLVDRIRKVGEVLERLQLARQGFRRGGRESGGALIPLSGQEQARTIQNLTALRERFVHNIQRQNEQVRSQGLSVVPETQEVIARLRPLERTLLNAFQGMGRRFTATLQFAISGALIFSFQRLIREAVKTAVEVERAFEDIATALEFDIQFDRGTAEFNQTLERIRVGVLQIADEFNILPTVANKVAFQMVARFKSAENALIATRAQLIALKVSTIDADEILRALTATSEVFAAEVFLTNESLDLQQRLLARETAAAKLYIEALDQAVQIQQEWGVSVEDSIEGTARSAEVFRQLGFTMQETQAIIASVVFQLGQTGTNVAERANRAVSAITSPQIRDQLLDLAAANDEFFLTFAQFESGKDVLASLSAQYKDLQRVAPQVAQQILQIVGQRREAEVVAAILGGTDIQQQITEAADDAAGAAERRFGFLRDTTAEILASIGEQFEELSQNFERLGGLEPFQLILRTADKLLNIVNEVLKAVNALVVGLQSIPGIGPFAQLLPTLISYGIALRTAIRLSKGLLQIKAIQGIGSFLGFGGGGGQQQQLPFPNAVGLFTPVRESAAVFSKALRAGGIGITTASRGMVASLALSTKAIATEAAARTAEAAANRIRVIRLLALAFILGSFASAVDAAKRSTEVYETTLKNLNNESRSRFIREKTPPREQERELAANALQAARDAGAAAGSEFGTAAASVLLPAFAAFFSDETQENIDDPETRRRLIERTVGSGFAASLTEFNLKNNPLGNVFNALISRQTADAQRALVAGSEENRRALENDALLEFLRADLPLLVEEYNKLPAPEGQLQERAIASFGDQLLGLGLALDAAVTNEEIEAAEERQTALRNALLAYWASIGKDIDTIEGTFKFFQDKIQKTQQRLGLGQISELGAAAIFEGTREQLLTLADDIREIHPEEAAKLDRLAGTALQAQTDAISAHFDVRRELADATLTEEGRLLVAVNAFTDEVRRLAQTTNFAALRRARIELIQAQKALHDFYASQAKEAASFASSFFTGEEAQIDIQKQLAKVLRDQAVAMFASGNISLFGQAAELLKEAEEIRLLANKAERELEPRRIRAVALSTGPILSRLNELTAELDGLRADLALAGEGTIKAIEVQNAINRQLIEIQTEVINAAGASALLQAGVNDSILKLKAQLSINAKELEAAAVNYKVKSVQYKNLKIREQELKNSLANALLELRDLNRRLDSDVTNSFEQAQLDLVSILEKLAAPDLGELERKRLEVERINAEARAKQEFFSNQLFELQFGFETGEFGTSAYISALERLLAEVDTSTTQGKEIFLQIQSVIDGLTNDVSNLAFNIPGAIRLPTLFEIRRSLAADQLGVNYQDNRAQEINVFVSDEVDVQDVISAIEGSFGGSIDLESQRLATGGTGITIGSFS